MLPSYRPLVMMLSLLMMRSGAQAFLVGAGALPLGSRRAGAAAARAGLSGLLAVGARPSDVLLSTGSIPSTLEVILSRRTVNDFEPALPDGWSDALERSVLAATHAPNHKRTEPWRFHLLGPVAVKRVCELNAELVAAKKGPEAGEKKLARWLAMPGWLVVTQVVDGSSMEEPAGVAREDYAACCCAVQNLCLSLHSEGLGAKWTTGPVNFDERFAEAAGLPADEQVVGTVWFGRAAKTPTAPRKRLGVGDVLIRHD